MKKMLFVILTLGYTLLGFHAGANPLNTEEAKEDTTISMNQVSDAEPNEAERNSFANIGLISGCSFDLNDFYVGDCVLDLTLSTNYGIVFGKSAIADAGILEGTVGINGRYQGDKGRSSYLIGGGFGIDINFIKNDSINKIIPGLFLSAGVSYNKPESKDGYIIGAISVGALLKAFLSKQLAFISSLGAEYSHGYFTQVGYDGVFDSPFDDLKIYLGLGVRYYF